MCLFSKWRFPKRAEKDILCYKVLEKRDGNFYPPYINNGPIDIQEIYKAKGCSLSLIANKEKSKGYIHVYLYQPDVIELRGFYFGLPKRKYVLFECIIPKGTKYHVGEFETCACCKKLNIIKEISSFTS